MSSCPVQTQHFVIIYYLSDGIRNEASTPNTQNIFQLVNGTVFPWHLKQSAPLMWIVSYEVSEFIGYIWPHFSFGDPFNLCISLWTVPTSLQRATFINDYWVRLFTRRIHSTFFFLVFFLFCTDSDFGVEMKERDSCNQRTLSSSYWVKIPLGPVLKC